MPTVSEVQNKKGTKYRAYVQRAGYPKATRIFDTREAAVAWAEDLDRRIREKVGEDKTKLRHIAWGLDTELSTSLGVTEGDILDKAKFFPLQRLCGVYFIVHNNKIDYIGQSNNIIARLGQHAKDGRRCDRVTYMPCAESELEALEAYYIRKFKPAGNKILLKNKKLREAPAVERKSRLGEFDRTGLTFTLSKRRQPLAD